MKKNRQETSKEYKELGRKRLVNYDSPFATKEAYVKLRTNMMFSMTKDKAHPCKVFEITSSNPSEGKSITAANVAISFAMLGKRTMLIDADMRKPAQKYLWDADVSTGLCDYLAGLGPLGHMKVDELPLEIIFTGTIPPNPSELLASKRMKILLETFKEHFDYVIIDTPPINTVADAQILSALADGIVLVVRSGASNTEEFKNAVNNLNLAGGNLCGVVLNGISSKSIKYSKYRYGKYEYEYYYSYSD